MYDLILRGGTVVDGTGAPAQQADVAVHDGRVVAVQPNVEGEGERERDVSGRLVTPGFVDVHTHYDAQVTWDPYVTPSTWHGVTTAVMGNCGVGFAPAKPDGHKWLIGLMEGVEDIPGAAMTEGMVWNWESFPEYLDALDGQSRCIDIAAQVPHGALRAYVMGRRGAKHERATREDLDAMARIVREGIEAGALGFSTSRTLIHKGMDGEYVPGTFADEDELMTIAQAMQAGGGGVFQMTSNHVDMAEEFPWMRRIAAETGQHVSFNLLQTDEKPELWRHMLSLLDSAADEGVPVFAQVAGRPAGVLMLWEGTANPFLLYPSYMPMHHLPFPERYPQLRAGGLREKLAQEEPFSWGEFEDFIMRSFHKMYRLGTPPDYEPDPALRAESLAKEQGCAPQEIIFDWLMENDGRGIIYFPVFNYAHGNMDHMKDLLEHPRTVLGLGDGGAHCGVVCDASIQTFMLTHWVRDRARGARMGLENVVRIMTSETAALYGLADRGRLEPGYKADINVIDFERLHLPPPEMAYDLPAGGRRLLQRADGFEATIVSGEVIFEHGEPTGAMPGGLLRGAPSAPA